MGPLQMTFLISKKKCSMNWLSFVPTMPDKETVFGPGGAGSAESKAMVRSCPRKRATSLALISSGPIPASKRSAVIAGALPGLILAVIGLIIGIILARGAAGVLQSLIWGIQPRDTVSFACGAALLFFAAAVASVLPSLRIAQIDPARTLRDE